MARVSWDSTVFQPISAKTECLDLVHTVNGTSITVKQRDSRNFALSEIVFFAKELLGNEVPKPLSDRAHLFLRLESLREEIEEFNREVQGSLWITAIHVLLLILSLGIFSFQIEKEIEDFIPQIGPLFGVESEEKGQVCLRGSMTFQDLYSLSPKMRERVLRELSCEAQYEKKKELLDEAHEKGQFSCAMHEPLAALEARYSGFDLLGATSLFLKDPSALEKQLVAEWSLEKICAFFGGEEGADRWRLLFQHEGARELFAQFSEERVAQLIECAEGDKPLLFIKEIDEGGKPLFFRLLSRNHWESLKGKTMETFWELEGRVDFSHLTIQKTDWQIHLAAQLYSS